MPRQPRPRKIVKPPGFKGFKPYGNPGSGKEKVELLYEEYEAIKLADYDLLTHKEASRLMGVSRPTFARIYETARRKIATVLVETRELKAIYGNVILDHHWFLCNHCYARFTLPKNLIKPNCPVCREKNIESVIKSTAS